MASPAIEAALTSLIEGKRSLKAAENKYNTTISNANAACLNAKTDLDAAIVLDRQNLSTLVAAIAAQIGA